MTSAEAANTLQTRVWFRLFLFRFVARRENTPEVGGMGDGVVKWMVNPCAIRVHSVVCDIALAMHSELRVAISNANKHPEVVIPTKNNN